VHTWNFRLRLLLTTKGRESKHAFHREEKCCATEMYNYYFYFYWMSNQEYDESDRNDVMLSSIIRRINISSLICCRVYFKKRPNPITVHVVCVNTHTLTHSLTHTVVDQTHVHSQLLMKPFHHLSLTTTFPPLRHEGV